MPKSKSHKKKRQPKRVLALPDLEQAKAAVLNSLTSASGQRTYDHAISRDFDHVLTAWSGGANETLCDVAVVNDHGARGSQLPPTLRGVRSVDVHDFC